MPRKFYEFQGMNDIHPNPYCWPIRMALVHQGLEDEFITVRFGKKIRDRFQRPKQGASIGRWRPSDSRSWTIACSLEVSIQTAQAYLAVRLGVPVRVLSMSGTTVSPLQGCIVCSCQIYIYENAVAPSRNEYFCTTREKQFRMNLEEFSDRSESRLKAFRWKFGPARSVLGEKSYLAVASQYMAITLSLAHANSWNYVIL